MQAHQQSNGDIKNISQNIQQSLDSVARNINGPDSNHIDQSSSSHLEQNRHNRTVIEKSEVHIKNQNQTRRRHSKLIYLFVAILMLMGLIYSWYRRQSEQQSFLKNQQKIAQTTINENEGNNNQKQKQNIREDSSLQQVEQSERDGSRQKLQIQPQIMQKQVQLKLKQNKTQVSVEKDKTQIIQNAAQQITQIKSPPRKWKPIKVERLKNAEKYHDIWKVTSIKQLPFCIFLPLPIIPSILTQNYSNFRTLAFPLSLSQAIDNFNQVCLKHSLVIFLNGAVDDVNLLNSLNQVHQTYNSWATYTKNNDSIWLASFYYRLLQLAQINDFDGSHSMLMQGATFSQILALAIIQLSEYHMTLLDHPSIKFSLSLKFSEKDIYNSLKYQNITSYTKIYKLTQDFPVDQSVEEERLNNLRTLKSNTFNGMIPQKMFKAIQRQQLMYLPSNHSLFQLECIENEWKQQKKQDQIPLCITVLSHNNINQSRYVKAMASILQQKYQNYHIVFIDDYSSDANMEMTIKYMKANKFPQERITYVQNKQRKFATFNIINAAFSYCQPDDVQVLLDGDDQFIGTLAFKVIANAYKGKPNKWIVYSNFKSNLFTYGTSRYIRRMSDLLDTRANRRKSGHFIGPIRSWRVKLLYNIPLSYHMNQKGMWLDTVYDDAIQHCLVELSGLERLQYIPKILYEYNKLYGDNDDSSLQKKQNRHRSYQWILGLKPLKKLQKLDNSIKDKGVYKIFESERGIKFQQIKQ